jgi:hypothetical protein
MTQTQLTSEQVRSLKQLRGRLVVDEGYLEGLLHNRTDSSLAQIASPDPGQVRIWDQAQYVQGLLEAAVNQLTEMLEGHETADLEPHGQQPPALVAKAS